MAREATCAWTTGRTTRTAKLHLEGKRLDVRAADAKATLDLASARAIRVAGHALVVDFSRERHSFALGAAAPKWLAAIATTKTVAQKLGIKPESAVAFLGGFDPATIAELTAGAGVTRAKSTKRATIVIALVEREPDTRKALKTFAMLDRAVATWLVFPKGRGVAYGETSVRAFARAAGFIDVKVVAFSPTHSSLRFTRAASTA